MLLLRYILELSGFFYFSQLESAPAGFALTSTCASYWTSVQMNVQYYVLRFEHLLRYPFATFALGAGSPRLLRYCCLAKD
jgi:hypothetical protein